MAVSWCLQVPRPALAAIATVNVLAACRSLSCRIRVQGLGLTMSKANGGRLIRVREAFGGHCNLEPCLVFPEILWGTDWIESLETSTAKPSIVARTPPWAKKPMLGATLCNVLTMYWSCNPNEGLSKSARRTQPELRKAGPNYLVNLFVVGCYTRRGGGAAGGRSALQYN